MDVRESTRGHRATLKHHRERPTCSLICWESRILNKFGPATLFALTALLLGKWNIVPPAGLLSDATSSLSIPDRWVIPAPDALGKSQGHVTMLTVVCAGLGTSQRFGELLLGSAFSAALPRAWKVFGHRTCFMQLSYSA